MRIRFLSGLAAVAVAITFSACGSDSGSSDPAATDDSPVETEASDTTPIDTDEISDVDVDPIVAAAAEIIEAARAVPDADNLGEPIDVSPLAGQTIYSIPIDSANQFFTVGEEAMRRVAAQADVELITFPTDGTQTSFQQGFAQAINAGAAVILLNGPLPETLGPQIEEANAAGIPVVPLHLSDVSEPTLEGLPYEAFAPFNDAARLMVLYAVADLEGPVNALVIQSAETGPAAGMVASIEETIANEAPAGSTVTVIDAPVPQWATSIQGQVQSALLRDPEINAVLPIYDSMSTYVAPGIEQSASDRGIGIYTFNGTPAILDMINQGIVAMDTAESPDWVAYVNVDTAFRAMLGVDPNTAATGPLRVIDISNVDETGTPPEANLGFGDEYPSAYLVLWGLE